MGHLFNAKSMPRVEAANALELTQFRLKYLFNGASQTSLTIDVDNKPMEYCITLEFPSTLSIIDFESCFNLIETTSSADYANSGTGWSPIKKRREMRLPDLRYLLLKRGNTVPGDSLVEGFLSFMVTYEDGHEVIYCYEIHLTQDLQGCGIGKRLMRIVEEVGHKIGLKKVMLTVFVCNRQALKFYERLGYDEDDYSPEPRKLRGGVIKKPDYMILSKEPV